MNKKTKIKVEDVARHLIQLSGPDGAFLSTRSQLSEKFNRQINKGHFQTWKRLGLIEDFDWTPKKHDALHYFQTDIRTCCRVAGLPNPHEKIKETSRKLTKVSTMTFGEKLTVILNLFFKLFIKPKTK